MYKNLVITGAALLLLFASCKQSGQEATSALQTSTSEVPFLWENANLYFLLTDRFNNADKTNDVNFDRNLPTAPMRGFQGGDIKGITEKIKEGNFNLFRVYFYALSKNWIIIG